MSTLKIDFAPSLCFTDSPSSLKFWLKPLLPDTQNYFLPPHYLALLSRDSIKAKSILYTDWGNQLKNNVYKRQLKLLEELVGYRVTWKNHKDTFYMCSLSQRRSQNTNSLANKCQTTPPFSQIYRELNWSTHWESNLLTVYIIWIESRTQDVSYSLIGFPSFTNAQESNEAALNQILVFRMHLASVLF